MPIIQVESLVRASIERCFDLALDVDLHQRSMAHTAERAVAGRTSGMLELGDTVTWEAVHLGGRQRLTVRITRLERPHVFVDQMVRGAFRSFVHLHTFTAVEGGTLIGDHFDYRSPLGLLGSLADRLFLKRYMRRMLRGRQAALKQAAESDPFPTV